MAMTASDAWIRSSAPGAPTTAAYFRLRNNSDEDRRLVSAESAIAERVEIHEHMMQAGLMTMQSVDSVLLAKQSTTEFAPGGLHIMFIGLKAPVTAGEVVRLKLQFANGSEQWLALMAHKQVPEGDAPAAHQHRHKH